MDLERAEEVRDLERRGLRCVRAVHGVGLDRARELLADRAHGRLRRVGRTHQIAPLLNGVIGLEHHRDAWPLGHERAQALEERPLTMDRVEARGVVGRHADQLEREDLEAGRFDASQDGAGGALGDGVGLDDGQCALGHAPITFATVAPMSAGLFTTVTPASCNAFIFSAAVPLPPAMIAPAWPMRRPGGAVCPQMKPTTGLSTPALMNAAASSSAVPPISPIIMIARVPASSLKSRNTSTKLVPFTGSPPMPTQVD